MDYWENRLEICYEFIVVEKVLQAFVGQIIFLEEESLTCQIVHQIGE